MFLFKSRSNEPLNSSQINSVENLYNPSVDNNTSPTSSYGANQQTSLNLATEEVNYSQQSNNYADQISQQSHPQQVYSNYPMHYQLESSMSQPVYSTSVPNYSNQIQDSSIASFGTSPNYHQQSQQQQNLDSMSTVNTQQPQQQQPHIQNLEQANYISGNFNNKVIEMPILQSSMNINEGMYQQVQQQKSYATSTTYATPATSSGYPWPKPR